MWIENTTFCVKCFTYLNFLFVCLFFFNENVLLPGPFFDDAAALVKNRRRASLRRVASLSDDDKKIKNNKKKTKKKHFWGTRLLGASLPQQVHSVAIAEKKIGELATAHFSPEADTWRSRVPKWRRFRWRRRFLSAHQSQRKKRKKRREREREINQKKKEKEKRKR